MTPKEISVVMGIHPTTVYNFSRKDWKDRSRRRNAKTREMRLALQRQSRDTAARKRGGSLGEAYSLIRKLASVLDAAHNNEADKEARAALSSAIHRAYRVEDEIVRALGISDPTATGLYAASKYEGRIAQPALSKAKIVEIRRDYAAGGVSQETLGEMYGVSQSTIHKAVHDLVGPPNGANPRG